MCGIFFSLSSKDVQRPSDRQLTNLKCRGPDSVAEHAAAISQDGSETLQAYFLSTVLSLRGDSIVAQPLIDEGSGSVLCWNGEAWKIGTEVVSGNDAQCIFELLLIAARSRQAGHLQGDENRDAVVEAISSIMGPFAFIFYDAFNSRIFYGRDRLGRRSLLMNTDSAKGILMSSISDPASPNSWVEVPANGLYVLDAMSQSKESCTTLHIPYAISVDSDDQTNRSLILPQRRLNKSLPEANNWSLNLASPAVDMLQRHLRDSLTLRVQNIRDYLNEVPQSTDHHTHVAILFSGGLDCSVMARMVHDILHQDESIDLLNVAFQNPRIHQQIDNDGGAISPYELCPDRVTGRASFAELQRVCPSRKWRFVEINVPYTETLAHREKVIELMYPHNTEMDLSISYALYFASRGVGAVSKSESLQTMSYTTPARVLLSGLGADELFGGYQRHATAFTRQGYEGLLDELELDIGRLGKRNLGRDDRVISNWSKEVRFPYLDEDLLDWALSAPVWEKCGFGQTSPNESDTTSVIEPGKRLLRLLAWRLGLHGAAVEKKRAIQFGARTAKMEKGKTKGTHLLV